MATWMCERWFEITVEGIPAIVPVRFTVEAATEEEADRLTEAAGVEAFKALAGGEFPGNPAGPGFVLYPL